MTVNFVSSIFFILDIIIAKKGACARTQFFVTRYTFLYAGECMDFKFEETAGGKKSEAAGQSEMICPLRLVMDIIGGKWKLNILCLLKDGRPLRYNQIKKGVMGITNVMLANSLKSFEEYGIVHREQYNEVPVRVEYCLTPKGLELIEALRLLERFGSGYISQSGHYESYCRACLYFEGGQNKPETAKLHSAEQKTCR